MVASSLKHLSVAPCDGQTTVTVGQNNSQPRRTNGSFATNAVRDRVRRREKNSGGLQQGTPSRIRVVAALALVSKPSRPMSIISPCSDITGTVVA